MWPSGSLVQLADKTKKNKKTTCRARTALHGRAINKQHAEQEPRSAGGRAVNKAYPKCSHVESWIISTPYDLKTTISDISITSNHNEIDCVQV